MYASCRVSRIRDVFDGLNDPYLKASYFSRPEPFSCFLPRFGSTISFIEQLERPIVSRLTPPQLQHYEPLPVWMLASAAFGVLCAASM